MANWLAPTPEADTSVIVGRMMTLGPAPQPYLGEFYLAAPIYGNQPNSPPLFAFSDTEAPKAAQDDTGRFWFAPVPAGEYAIVIWTPVGGTVITDPQKKSTLIIKAEAGKTVDLGIVSIP